MQGLNAKRYKNTIDCFVKIFMEEGTSTLYLSAHLFIMHAADKHARGNNTGLAGFYKGVVPRMG